MPNVIELADLAGPEWAGFRFWRQRLVIPGWRGEPLTPGDFRAMHWELQELRSLRMDCARLRTEAADATTAAQAAEDRAEWYRRQLLLESRAGLALAALVGHQ